MSDQPVGLPFLQADMNLCRVLPWMPFASASFEHSRLCAVRGLAAALAAGAGVAAAGAAAVGAAGAAAGAAGFGAGVWAMATVANRPIAAAAASFTKDLVIETSRGFWNARRMGRGRMDSLSEAGCQPGRPGHKRLGRAPIARQL